MILGEFSRKIDDRYRLSLPTELTDLFQPKSGKCIIAKERPGCLSLWEQEVWQTKLDESLAIVQSKVKAHKLEDRIPELQMFGRLLSTRQMPVELEERGRFRLPEGFREFIGVEPKNAVMVVGAAVCIEIWHPQKWIDYVNEGITEFQQLLENLSH